MSINTAKTILGGLLPFAANPIVLAVVGAGAAAWVVTSLFDEKEEQSEEDNQTGTVPNGYEPLSEPLKQAYSTVPATVNEPLVTVGATVIETDETTGEEPLTTNDYREDHDISSELDALSEEAEKKEIIRKVMSELGKRSGAARRIKSKRIKPSNQQMTITRNQCNVVNTTHSTNHKSK